MIGHPLQMGITVLVIMALCAIGGNTIETNGTMSAWLFFASLFIFAFGVMVPARSAYRSRPRRY